jgi:hypothetical protein
VEEHAVSIFRINCMDERAVELREGGRCSPREAKHDWSQWRKLDRKTVINISVLKKEEQISFETPV